MKFWMGGEPTSPTFPTAGQTGKNPSGSMKFWANGQPSEQQSISEENMGDMRPKPLRPRIFAPGNAR